MGSFNIQCIASRQLISPGDRCYVVPLLQQSTFNPVTLESNGQTYQRYGIGTDTVDSDAFWSPLSAFISGRYDDFGRIEVDDTQLNRMVLFEFISDLVRQSLKTAQGENPTHETAFDLPAFLKESTPGLWDQLSRTGEVFRNSAGKDSDFEEFLAAWEYIFDAAQANRLFRSNYLREPRPVKFAAIHGMAIDALVSVASEGMSWGNVPYEFKAYMASVREQVESDRRAGKEHYFLGSRIEHALQLHMPSYISSVLWPFMDPIREHVNQYLNGNLSFDSLVDSIEPFMGSIYAMKGMLALNIPLEPFLSAGQDYQNKQGEAFARFVTSVSQDISAEQKARKGE
jgi:hypothetical protein